MYACITQKFKMFKVLQLGDKAVFLLKIVFLIRCDRCVVFIQLLDSLDLLLDLTEPDKQPRYIYAHTHIDIEQEQLMR